MRDHHELITDIEAEMSISATPPSAVARSTSARSSLSCSASRVCLALSLLSFEPVALVAGLALVLGGLALDAPTAVKL
jgi:hypothetical protein